MGAPWAIFSNREEKRKAAETTEFGDPSTRTTTFGEAFCSEWHARNNDKEPPATTYTA